MPNPMTDRIARAEILAYKRRFRTIPDAEIEAMAADIDPAMTEWVQRQSDATLWAIAAGVAPAVPIPQQFQ